MTVRSEQVLESAALSIVRLNGTPRQVESGRHKRALVYVAADVTVPEAIRLLRGAAEQLAKTLPKVAP